MEDKVAQTIVAATTSPMESNPAAAVVSSKKVRSKPTHPRTSEMVNAAIKSLKERSGSSLQAIKKYVASTYKMDAEKHAPFIKRYLKAAVASGALVQTKGKGASGSFKLASTKADAPKSKVQQRSSPKTKSPKKKTAVKKPAADKKAAIAKKSDVGKKAAAATKKPVAVKKSPAAAAAKKDVTTVVHENRKVVKAAVAKASKAKSPSKVKKITKAPTMKPKAPKPKKAAPASKSAKSSPKKQVVQKK